MKIGDLVVFRDLSPAFKDANGSLFSDWFEKGDFGIIVNIEIDAIRVLILTQRGYGWTFADYVDLLMEGNKS